MIGLRDEYNFDEYACFQDRKTLATVDTGCQGGLYGLMGYTQLNVQPRNYDELFASLSDLTLGHTWVVGRSPDWVDMYPVDSNMSAPTLFESTLTLNEVPEPGTLALVLAALGICLITIQLRPQMSM